MTMFSSPSSSSSSFIPQNSLFSSSKKFYYTPAFVRATCRGSSVGIQYIVESIEVNVDGTVTAPAYCKVATNAVSSVPLEIASNFNLRIDSAYFLNEFMVIIEDNTDSCGWQYSDITENWISQQQTNSTRCKRFWFRPFVTTPVEVSKLKTLLSDAVETKLEQ